jgi:hypothetical protein
LQSQSDCGQGNDVLNQGNRKPMQIGILIWRRLLSRFLKFVKIMMNYVNVWYFLLQFPDAPRPYTRPNLRHSGSIREQLRASWLTALIGCVLFAAGMKLLFWNEVRAVYVKTCLCKFSLRIQTSQGI